MWVLCMKSVCSVYMECRPVLEGVPVYLFVYVCVLCVCVVCGPFVVCVALLTWRLSVYVGAIL